MLFKLLGPKKYLVFSSFVEKYFGIYITILFIGILTLIALPFWGLYYFGNLNQDFKDIGFTRAKVIGAVVLETDDDVRRMHISYVTSDGSRFSTSVRRHHFAMKGDIICLNQRLGEDQTTIKFRQVNIKNCKDLKPFNEHETPATK